jgi:hypothetical protein
LEFRATGLKKAERPKGVTVIIAKGDARGPSHNLLYRPRTCC